MTTCRATRSAASSGAYGKFTRRFALPRSVDAAKVAAEYKDGVLTVRLPMREEVQAPHGAGGGGVLTGPGPRSRRW